MTVSGSFVAKPCLIIYACWPVASPSENRLQIAGTAAFDKLHRGLAIPGPQRSLYGQAVNVRFACGPLPLCCRCRQRTADALNRLDGLAEMTPGIVPSA